MAIANKHTNAILTNDLTTPLLIAGATETIRITHLVATCTAVNSGTLTLKTIDASNSDKSANLLNAVPLTIGKPIEFFDAFLEPGDSLQGGFSGTPTDPHVVIFYQVEIPTLANTTLPPNTTSKALTYVSDGDTNGVCYWVGTNFGTEAWSNPHNAGRLILTSTSIDSNNSGAIAGLVDRANSDFFTQNNPDQRIIITLPTGYKLIPNYYLMKTGNDDFPRNWKLQGLDSAATWVDLDTQTNNVALTEPNQSLSIPISGTTTEYNQFSILQTGVNHLYRNHLRLDEIELYGTLTTTT